MTRATALRMIKRRTRQVGLPPEICAHSFGGPGSRSISGTAATLRSPRGSPVMSRPAPRSSIIGSRTKFRSTRSSGFTFEMNDP